MRKQLYRIAFKLVLLSLVSVQAMLGTPLEREEVRERFANRKLSQLSQLMPGMSWPGHDTIMGYERLPANKSLVIRYNRKQEIEHLGISLFSLETKRMLDESICNFLERTFLELVLLETNEDVKRKLTEYHIRLRYNGYDVGENGFTSMYHVLQELTMPVNFTIKYEDKYGSASWNLNRQKHLSLLFPMSKELIDGMDKKESDSLLYDRLAQAPINNHSYKDEPVRSEELVRQGKDLYVKKGSYFMIPSLTSDAYYVKEGTSFVPLFSAEMPDKSLCTLFHTYANGSDKRLLITHRQYGFFTPEIELPLNDFLAMFERDFDIFSAANKNKKEEWETVVVIRHKVLNYIHLMRVITAGDKLKESPLVLKADFYSNIPQHYIKSLFNIKTK